MVCKITNFYFFKQKPYAKQKPSVIVGTHGVAELHVGPKSGLMGTYISVSQRGF